jgi:tryptophan halogenase
MKKHINKIVIVGGGSAGWMSAAALVKSFPDTEIVLVESPDVPTVGVGESTLGYINNFLDHLGIADEEWMPACNATYKLSIKFRDFYEKNSSFHYPFGFLDYTYSKFGIMDWFIYAGQNPDVDPNDFAKTYMINYLLAENNKCWSNDIEQKLRVHNWRRDKAYHMDAAAFGEWLKNEYCLPRGVEYIADHIVTANLTLDGDIESVQCKDNLIKGDLFLDCTGFNSILMTKILKEPFIYFNDTLMNNRAVAAQYQYTDKEKEMEPYTNCTAHNNGWVWNIPLWHRVGSGYVYSDKFITPEKAEQEFKDYLDSDKMTVHNPERSKSCVFKHIKIRHGRQRRTWVKNCVAVGLANGFIEPLESTGLLLTHEVVMKLINVLESSRGRVTRLDKDSLNHAIAAKTDAMKEFVSAHYALSTRDDTPYWQHVTNEIEYDSETLIDLKPNTGSVWYHIAQAHQGHKFDQNDQGLLFIMAGMKWWPQTKTSLRADEIAGYNHSDAFIAMENYNRQKLFDERMVEDLPSHYEFLKTYVYKDTNNKE